MTTATVKRGLVIFVSAALVACELGHGWESMLSMPAPASIAFTLTLLAALWWISEVVPLYVTSLSVLLAALVWLAPCLPYEDAKSASRMFLAPFFSSTILLFFGGFVVARGLSRYEWDEQLATWMLRKTGGKTSAVMLALMASTAFLSMWMSNTATTAMMLGLCTPLLAQRSESDSFANALLLAVPFSANLGGMVTPVGTPPNAIVLSSLDDRGLSIDFGHWMLLMLPLALLSMALLWGLLSLRYHFGGSALASKTVLTFKRAADSGPVSPFHDKPDPTWARKRALVLSIVLLTAGLWLCDRFLPLSSGEIALLPTILFFGLGLLNVKDFRSLPWDVLILIGGGMCLGVAIEESGLSNWFVSGLPHNLGQESLRIVFGGVTLSLTNLMSNAAVASLITPVALSLSSLDGCMPLVIAACASLAMALPISTPPNAIAFATGKLRVKEMALLGIPLSLGGALIVWFLATVYWPWVLGW